MEEHNVAVPESKYPATIDTVYPNEVEREEEDLKPYKDDWSY